MDKQTVGVALDAVLLDSTSPEALAEFYRKAFDLAPPKYSGDDHLGINLKNMYLGFDRVAHRSPMRGAVRLWFRVEEIDATYAHLIHLGARGEMPPNRDESPGEILATLVDPEGNPIGLIAADS